MKRGNRTGVLPVGKITKRLPVGGRKRRTPDLSRITKSLPNGLSKGRSSKLPGGLPGGLPSGRTAGTAGGVLLGAGAAVAAGRALSRRGNGGDDSEETTPKETKAKSKGTKAKGAKSENVEETRSESGDGNPVKGLFGGVTETIGKALKGGGGSGGGKKVKVTNIVEHTDIGAPRRLVYNQWTQFQDYPSFMKKVVSVDQAEDGKLNWKAKIFWSSRTWESTIVEQVPDEHIVWRSKGSKGHVDGTVSFHKLAPNLTRVLLVLEYHPQGLFERTGNLWRAQGRRARLELKHFGRYVMTQSLTHPDDVEGWRGEIHDSEVVRTHEEALDEEKRARKEKDAKEYEEAR
ncbi:SRPBCC family protein [Actinomadura rubrisoli]|uniref:SRPBCC family protein n=1 Tax=Actinomadura rubrisoli TaxID=2530368 RepID=A0A4R5BPL1_9ACTN|nr:SRPBCC family protein [Actinomadura rubrisoli]TDD87130.1 SRPBCC family protein [Actinomadura rubrisoli]